jgi:hypothetical protein
MGYWGYFIVAAWPSSLGELPCMRPIAGLTPDRKLGDEWQIWRSPAEPPLEADELAAALFRETRRPALVGFVMDSDCLVIEASDPVNGTWTACLSPVNTAGYLVEDGKKLEDWVLSPEQAARCAVAWIGSAGRKVAKAPLVDLFQREADPVVEDIFFELIGLLGLHACGRST